MSPISIKIQKIVMLIPGINPVCLAIWLYNSFFIVTSYKTILRSISIVFTSSVPLAILQVIISYYLPLWGTVIGYINSYIIPLILGYRLIRLQEELMDR